MVLAGVLAGAAGVVIAGAVGEDDALGAVFFAIDRPARPLQRAHARVAIHGHQQSVAQRPRRLQIAHVADMQEVEAAIGKNETLARGGKGVAHGGELLRGLQFRGHLGRTVTGALSP